MTGSINAYLVEGLPWDNDLIVALVREYGKDWYRWWYQQKKR